MSLWDRKKHSPAHELPNGKVHGKHAVQDSALRKTRKNSWRFFLNARPANGVMWAIKSAAHQKQPWWHGGNMQVNVRERHRGPERCSWNSECRWYQQTDVQWLLKSSCWNWPPKPQGLRIFWKMRVRFPQQALARGSQCILLRPTCTCLRFSPWCQQEFPACGEELNVTVKICRADLREEFLSLSVENVMIYLIVRKKDRNSMKIFKRKHTHTQSKQPLKSTALK